MFVIHANRLSARVNTIRRAVQSSDMVRNLLAEPAFDPKGMPDVNGQNSGQWLKTYAPQTVDWKEFDHNSAVTALYAAYECCVTDLLREWVAIVMPIRWPDYHADLPPEIQRHYVEGIARLLPKMGRSDRNRYQQLELKVLAREFADTTNGMKPYRLHPDAFFSIDQNLRSDRLSTLFSSVGLSSVWQWVSSHPRMIDYYKEIIGEANSLEQELSKFVQARNDAAHGAQTGTYPGTTEIEQFGIFAERLGLTLIEKARHDMLRHYLTINRMECLGVVTEVFKKSSAVVVKAAGTFEVSTGMQVALLTDFCCDLDELVSCELNGVPHQTLTTVAEQELGFKFKNLPRKGTQLVRPVATVPPAIVTPTAPAEPPAVTENEGNR